MPTLPLQPDRLALVLGRICLLGMLLAPLVSCNTATTQRCGYQFEAKVVQGPDLGQALAGNLVLELNPTGAISGVLTGPDGGQINVVGQATGRAVNLAFDVSNGLTIFGVGTARNEVSACQGVMGGPFVGPHPGSSGDWIATADASIDRTGPLGKPGASAKPRP